MPAQREKKEYIPAAAKPSNKFILEMPKTHPSPVHWTGSMHQQTPRTTSGLLLPRFAVPVDQVHSTIPLRSLHPLIPTHPRPHFPLPLSRGAAATSEKKSNPRSGPASPAISRNGVPSDRLVAPPLRQPPPRGLAGGAAPARRCTARPRPDTSSIVPPPTPRLPRPRQLPPPRCWPPGRPGAARSPTSSPALAPSGRCARSSEPSLTCASTRGSRPSSPRWRCSTTTSVSCSRWRSISARTWCAPSLWTGRRGSSAASATPHALPLLLDLLLHRVHHHHPRAQAAFIRRRSRRVGLSLSPSLPPSLPPSYTAPQFALRLSAIDSAIVVYSISTLNCGRDSLIFSPRGGAQCGQIPHLHRLREARGCC
jgi:hypothetical protein